MLTALAKIILYIRVYVHIVHMYYNRATTIPIVTATKIVYCFNWCMIKKIVQEKQKQQTLSDKGK